MVRPPSFIANLLLRQNPKSVQGTGIQIRNRNLSIDQINGNSEELMLNPQNPDANFSLVETNHLASEELQQNPQNSVGVLGQNQISSISEIAEEISNIIRSRPRWEHTLLSDFPSVNFAEPTVYNEVLKHQNDAFLSLRFYLWLKSLNGSLSDQDLCNVIFGRLVEAGDAKSAKSFLEDTTFEPEPSYLELYIRCLCENGLIDEAVIIFEHLKMIGHCASLQTWNWAFSHSVRTKRVDVVWRLYGEMTEFGVVTDVNTIGHLIRAFCLENDFEKGHDLLQQVLQTGHVPDNVVFNDLISLLFMYGQFGTASAILHYMIEKNCSPDLCTYQAVINGLCKGGLREEAFRVFNELKDRGYSPDIVMYTTMIQSFCQGNDVREARKLWLEMIQKGIVANEHSYGVFIDGLMNTGYVHEAKELYKEMLDKGYGETSVMYTIMINGLCLNDKVEEAALLFGKMNEKGIPGISDILTSLMERYLREGKITQAMYFFTEFLKQGLRPSVPSFSILIRKLCEAGQVNEAETLWLDMQNRGFDPAIHCLNHIIFWHSNQGHAAKGMEYFTYMRSKGANPKKKVSKRLVKCLSEVNRMNDALSVLGYMTKVGFVRRESIRDLLEFKLSLDNSISVKNGLGKFWVEDGVR